MKFISVDKKLQRLNEIQQLTDSINAIWNFLSPSLKENQILKAKFQEIKTIKEKLEVKIQGDLKNENTK